MRRLAWTGWMWLMGLPILLAADIRFEASTDAREVFKGSAFEVTFTLHNSKGTAFRPPQFKNLKVISGPSQSMQTSIVNGVVSSQQSFSYVVQAVTTGTVVVGSASITAGNQTYTTKPITINVLANNAQAAPGKKGEDVFVKLDVSTTSAFIGQQIILDYKLFTKVNVSNFELQFEPSYPNSYAENIASYNLSQHREIYEGQEYVTKVMRRIALFPQQAGPIHIEPAVISLGIEYDDPRYRGFFFRSQLKMVNLTTNDVDISVRSNPVPEPDDFAGAVGHFTMQVDQPASPARTEEAVSILMQVKGDGDEKRLMAPRLVLPEGLEGYDPKVKSSQTGDEDGRLVTTRIFEYLVVPRKTGSYTIRPSFSFLDPDSSIYVTRKDSFRLEVLQGALVGSNPGVRGDDVSDDGELRYLATGIKLHQSAQLWGRPLHWILVVFPMVLSLGAILYRRRQWQEGQVDAGIRRQRQAVKVATKRLTQAQALLDVKNYGAFYEEVSRASHGYVSDKFRIPVADLTKDRVNREITAYGGETFAGDFVHLLQTCERALYAGMANQENAQETYDEAVRLISGLELVGKSS